MPDQLSEVDLNMMYNNAVVLYKGRPVYVHSTRGGVITFYDYSANEMQEVLFEEEYFTSPARRLGMVNIQDDCVYVTRNPVRKYSVGFNAQNLNVKQLAGASATMPFRTLHSLATRLQDIGIANSINNIYPNLQEAIKSVLNNGGTQAFDKQFAVDKKLRVFYKTQIVGSVDRAAKSDEAIEFAPGNSHLRLLLMNNYQKSLERSA